jgi:hypothetical protein
MNMENVFLLQSHGLDVDTTGDKATWVVPQKCEVIRAIVGISSNDAGGGTVSFDLTADGGSESVGALGSIVIPAADHQFEAYYDEVAQGTILEAGNVVIVDVKADAGAGPAFSAYLLLRYLPEEPANQTDLLETA